VSSPRPVDAESIVEREVRSTTALISRLVVSGRSKLALLRSGGVRFSTRFLPWVFSLISFIKIFNLPAVSRRKSALSITSGTSTALPMSSARNDRTFPTPAATPL
jgi:hypothetical protein